MCSSCHINVQRILHINIAESDQILVLWDFNDWKMVCRYGDAGFDVKVVNEPRILDEGENFAIGCRVKPSWFNFFVLTFKLIYLS